MKLIFALLVCFITLPGLCQEDDEQLVDTIEAERRKQVETAVKLNDAQENLKSAVFNAPKELQKLGYKTLDAAAFKDERVVKIVQKMFDNSPLRSMTIEQVRNLMLEKVKGEPYEGLLRSNPKLVDAFADVLRDEKAMPSLLGVLLRKDDLKIYGLIWLGLIFFSWVFKKIFFDKDWSRGKRFFMSILVSLSVTALSLGIFYKMFNEEVSPTVTILSRHWNNRNI
jgi:hypothetical protein